MVDDINDTMKKIGTSLRGLIEIRVHKGTRLSTVYSAPHPYRLAPS